MNLQLRNIKFAAFASQETNCYEAAVYLDGKKVALVSNEGHGGCDMQHWLDRDAQAKIEAHFKSLPTRRAYDMDIQPDLEDWCGEQVEAHLQLKSLKTRVKRKVNILTADGKNLVFKFAPKELTPALRAKIAERHTGARFMHEMSDDELVAVIRAEIAKS